MMGATPGTFETWLALRGLRTLHVRLERAQSNAQELVRRLGEHPAVGEVRYPGFGAIVSVVLAEGALAADLLTHKTTLWVHATSLGGVESTFERRRRWKSEPATIADGLVRMSVGIEDVDDLWDDLATALDDLVGLTSSDGQSRSCLVSLEISAVSMSAAVISPSTTACTASTIGA